MFLQKNNTKEVDFDEILMDVRNIPGYHRGSFEGSLENPIKKNIFVFLGFSFFLVSIVFLSRLGFLEIKKGDLYLNRAQTNYLREVVYEPERGIVFDRKKIPLTLNELTEETESKRERWIRGYPVEGFLHSIGFLSRKENPNLAQGASGLELIYNDILKGLPGKFIEEVNSKGEIVSSGITENAKEGKNILLSIDSGLSLRLAHSIKNTAKTYGFNGGAAVVVNPKNGEVLALLSFPEFDPNILSKSPSSISIQGLVSDPKKPFFNRAVSGLYPPGSIIKPAIAAAALSEMVVDEKKEILSAEPIVIKNPYFPGRSDIFPDWKQHGWVDMKKALAVSSDIYFYEIGGGFGDQKGLGVRNILKYLEKFGFNSITGVDLPGEVKSVLPNPEKETSDKRKWGIGDTYHLSIGQGDIQVTPVAMVVYTSILANKGIFYSPHLVKSILGKNGELIEEFLYSKNEIDVKKEVFGVVREGMRDAVKYGTAIGLSGYPIDIAAKTGTAEVGETGKVHSWSIGFLPYEDPKVAWTIIMEGGPIHNTIGATFVASEMIQWMVENKFLESL